MRIKLLFLVEVRSVIVCFLRFTFSLVSSFVCLSWIECMLQLRILWDTPVFSGKAACTVAVCPLLHTCTFAVMPSSVQCYPSFWPPPRSNFRGFSTGVGLRLRPGTTVTVVVHVSSRHEKPSALHACKGKVSKVPVVALTVSVASYLVVAE